MIDVQNKVIYTHPQKTGGTSIETVFVDSKLAKKHASLTEHIDILESLSNDHTEYYKFSSVRNPWDVVVSHYHYDMKHLRKNPKIASLPRYNKVKEMNFDQYVRSEIFFGGNVNYYMFHAGRFAVNRVVRFENMQQDFDEVCNDIGIEPVQLPHINKTNHDHYTTYYTDETRRIVERVYDADISLFNYKFEI